MPFEPTSLLSVGSIIRLAGPDGLDEATLDGTVTEVTDGRVIARFSGWVEIWDTTDLSYDSEGGVWFPSEPGAITGSV